ncbi:MAG TPA: hypothetical protein VHH93_06220 [Gammaproteobacteria bacterium]|jgi:hypothetical protein|nr:hypothetical protein [Gammaproteobacteria bacterium]
MSKRLHFNDLYTSEDRPQRGGSYGLGKAVLWRFSSFSTVLFKHGKCIRHGSSPVVGLL